MSLNDTLGQVNISLNLIISQTKTNAPQLLDIIIILWGVFFVNLLLHKKLFCLGIIPRRWYGLPGIFFAPFLHADFNHLFFNSIPLLVLSNFVLINGISYFLTVSIVMMIISGALTWCFAKPGVHIGASSVITGYWALLVSNIYQQGTVTAVMLGLVCVYYFAGILYSVFPGKRGISWEGHLFGLIAGFIVSWMF